MTKTVIFGAGGNVEFRSEAAFASFAVLPHPGLVRVTNKYQPQQ
ncbi:hypothetical protein [Streptomyces rhizosphaericus]|nr:hypothetical protein [Streptomyces rhizosphaericus]